MVYEDLDEEGIRAKEDEMNGRVLAAATLMAMGKEDKELLARFWEAWNLEIAEERLGAPQLAAFSKMMMDMGATIANNVGQGSPAHFAHAVSVGFQIAHDYVVKYGKLLED